MKAREYGAAPSWRELGEYFRSVARRNDTEKKTLRRYVVDAAVPPDLQVDLGARTSSALWAIVPESIAAR